MAKRIYYYIARQEGGQPLSAASVMSAAGSMVSAATVLYSAEVSVDSLGGISAAGSVLLSASTEMDAVSLMTATVLDFAMNREYLSQLLRDWVQHPTGCWNDYNAAWKTWRTLRAYGGDKKIVSKEEALALVEPDPIDYPDLTCQGYFRVRTAQRIKSRLNSTGSLRGNISVDGWVGTGQIDLSAESFIFAQAQTLMSAASSMTSFSSCSARRVPDEDTRAYLSHLTAEPVRQRSGYWRDYNNQYKSYQNLLKLVACGFMKEEELPSKPRVEDYADLT